MRKFCSKGTYMPRKILLITFMLCTYVMNAQYRNDNVLFTTVDPFDLCAALEKNKGYVLLDVRSPGEHDDTSSSAGLNLGHLKGARNINISELGTRISELRQYKDQPIFVYCSHSQRSRRASKMLADSGFTKIFNVNGGLSSFYYTGAGGKDCLPSLIDSKNKYHIISASELCGKMKGTNRPFIMDVRSDSAFRRISLDPKVNALGTIRGAVSIPLTELPKRLSEIPRDREIIITDLNGGDAAKAAVLLTSNGFANVSMLVEGIDRLLYSLNSKETCVPSIYQSPVTYSLLSNKDFPAFISSNPDLVLIDVRTAEEFGNTFKDSWRNIGHIRNAINIPVTDLATRMSEIEKYKNKEILIYGFGTQAECFKTANTLQQNGFSKIRILTGGLFNLRWTAANVKGYSELKDYVVDVPEINW
jgi:rhodanese-related sulfurtransferase